MLLRSKLSHFLDCAGRHERPGRSRRLALLFAPRADHDDRSFPRRPRWQQRPLREPERPRGRRSPRRHDGRDEAGALERRHLTLNLRQRPLPTRTRSSIRRGPPILSPPQWGDADRHFENNGRQFANREVRARSDPTGMTAAIARFCSTSHVAASKAVTTDPYGHGFEVG